MTDFLNLIYWEPEYTKTLLINMAIAIGLFTCLRLFSGVISHINPSVELMKKDNTAFGISMAGVTLALTIVLTGAIYGEPIYNEIESVKTVFIYGVLAIVLMALTRLIFDKVTVSSISIKDEIVKGNIAAAITDAGNVIATAIILRAVMMWIEAKTLQGIGVVFVTFLVSQIILSIVTALRIKMLEVKSQRLTLQEQISKGNSALALKFAGKRVSTAFAIMAASNLVVFENYDIWQMLLSWMYLSVIMMIVIKLLYIAADKIILFRVNIDDEIINQQNTALGIVQAVIYISIGLLLSELMS